MLFHKAINYVGLRVSNYTIEKYIGEGAFGLCFIATTDTGQKVVIKKSKPRSGPKKDAFEADILSYLNDKRVPRFFDVIDEKGFSGLVLEYMNGITAQKLISKYKHKFSDEEFFNIGIKLIRILRYLHEKGVVHRDISPANVLIDNDEVYLIDFGIAKWADNRQFSFKTDFYYLGGFLMDLLYSSNKIKTRRLSWHRKLVLSRSQKMLLKKLFETELAYENIRDIEDDFITAFKP